MNRPIHIRATDPDEGLTQANIKHVVYRAHSLDKDEVIARILQAEGRGRTVVFTRTKRAAAKLVEELNDRGFNAAAVHGDLSQEQRERAMAAFKAGKKDILIATDVAARGIDVLDVTHVINHTVPDDPDTYLHRAGRTGRAGKTGIAVTFVDWHEMHKWALINTIINLCLAGELHFSIGYTEPGAGTDLASLTTKAVKDGDQWVINGQKTYTSLASYADYIWLAARTDPDAPKHRGITMFAVPTTDPGYSYSKISTMVNASTFNTFYDDVKVGDDAIIGGLDRGWHLITNQLNYERVGLSPPGMVEAIYEDTVAWAKETTLPDGRRVADQEWVQVNLARVRAGLDFLRLLNWKIAALDAAGQSPNPARH